MSDLRLCRDWIAAYIRPCTHVNHMHGEASLLAMIAEDTHATVASDDLRCLMREAGYEPDNPVADEWEWRISSVPFRDRPKARIRGWMAASRSLRATRRG